jgi:putative transposase
MPTRKRQLAFEFRTWGGRRAGAGRKRQGPRPNVPHRAREKLSRQNPLHVTLRVGRQVPSLRAQRIFAAVQDAMRLGKERFGFRLIHFAVLRDHIHLVAEAEGTRSLARGVKGLSIRIARKVNAVVRRDGQVFSDRYHARALTTPRQVHAALRYVLLNAQLHRNARLAGASEHRSIDSMSSAGYFDGWAPGVRRAPPRPPDRDAPICLPKRWLLTNGWRRYGPIDPFEGPNRRAPRTGAPLLDDGL